MNRNLYLQDVRVIAQIVAKWSVYALPLTEDVLEGLRKKCRAERVMVELNGMKQVADFYANMPEDWLVYQEIMFADASTFSMYNANMRSLVVDKVGGCEMIVFNRMTEDTDKMELHNYLTHWYEWFEKELH